MFVDYDEIFGLDDEADKITFKNLEGRLDEEYNNLKFFISFYFIDMSTHQHSFNHNMLKKGDYIDLIYILQELSQNTFNYFEDEKHYYHFYYTNPTQKNISKLLKERFPKEEIPEDILIYHIALTTDKNEKRRLYFIIYENIIYPLFFDLEHKINPTSY